jgi:hypothetical protein
MILLVAVTLQIPPAAKVVAAFILIYALMFGLKKIPALVPYLQGWLAIVVNIVLAVASLFVPPSGIQPSQLYTMSTGMAVINAILTAITTSAAAAGIHGTIKSMSQPTVLATVPPSTQVQEVPATLVPDNPKAVPTDPPK